MLLSIPLIASGCVPGDGARTPGDPAGFFSGIWHGWIAPVSLIWGFFNPMIRLYEQYNSGWWYDFGFYIAIIGGFGGISLVRKRSKKDE
ncbi:hypothetical protein ACFL6I_03605 [candidate division KSB1 bacterium]